MIRPRSQAGKPLEARYRFFKANAVYVVGRSAACAMALARAEQKAHELGLTVEWLPEDHPWDGDCEAPPIHVWGRVIVDGACIAALGGVGLTSWTDPYVRVVEAELFQEALAVLDHEDELEADKLAARATFAGVKDHE